MRLNHISNFNIKSGGSILLLKPNLALYKLLLNMKSTKKLKINDLKVNSFVTSINKLRGGAAAPTFNVNCPYFKTEPKTCVESVNWCWTP